MSAAGGWGGTYAGPAVGAGASNAFAAPGTIFVDCGSRAATLLVAGAGASAAGANTSLILTGNATLAALNLTALGRGRLVVNTSSARPVQLTILQAQGDGSGPPVAASRLATICGWTGGACSASLSASPTSSRSASPSPSPSGGLSRSASPSLTPSATPSASVAASPVATTISAPTSMFGVYNYPGPLTVSAWINVTGLVTITATNIVVTASGGFFGVGGGWPPGAAPGAAAGGAEPVGPCWLNNGFAYFGEGGAHGGCTAVSSSGTGCPSAHVTTYGSAFSPVALGCGGAPGQYSAACPPGGAGGAALRLIASVSLIVNGTILMDGASGAAGINVRVFRRGGGGACCSVKRDDYRDRLRRLSPALLALLAARSLARRPPPSPGLQ